MKLLVQRVTEASVSINNQVFGSIGSGLLVFVGVGRTDMESDVERLAKKLLELRIFEDSAGKMNLSILDVKGDILVISQFTLYADCRRGRRPDFISAAPPQQAERLYNYFLEIISKSNLKIQAGVFAAFMQVQLVNNGPVTIMLDSEHV